LLAYARDLTKWVKVSANACLSIAYKPVPIAMAKTKAKIRFIVNYKYATKLLQKMQIRKQIDYFFKKDRCF
jgi:hypothetical protein